ncbi:hypothetical protein ATCC90586_001001 [Pythium insidiosum]|nr:hypothetical protein ATCC90586_001001 [Pythium insidiosum]
MARPVRATSRAGLQMPPLLDRLRPLLLLVIFVFVVLPMFVYNVGVARLDTLPASLRACVNVAADRLDAQSDALLEQCFETLPPTTEVPDLVHFVYLPVQHVPLLAGESPPRRENFTFVQFAVVQSIQKALRPEMMVLHYPEKEPASYWYTQCQRHLSLHRVTMPKTPANGRSSLSVYQRRDVMQLLIALRALRKLGGVVFTDFNTVVLRSFRAWRRYALIAGLKASSTQTLSVSSRVLQASKGHPYIAYIESSLRQMLESDDARLRDTPLPRLIGELTVERYGQHDGKLNGAFVAARVFDGVPPQRQQSFLTAELDDQTIFDNLRFVTALHLESGDDTSAATSAVKAMVATQDRLVDIAALRKDKTLFGAMLRSLLTQQKEALETEIAAIVEELTTGPNAPGLQGPLVDAEGFPRADIDVYRVRHQRHAFACKQTDHRAVMARIEQLLPQLLAARKPSAAASSSLSAPPARRDDATEMAVTRETPATSELTKLPAFARVQRVEEDSPAAWADLRVDDRVVVFGTADATNHRQLTAVKEIVLRNVGSPIRVVVRRTRPTKQDATQEEAAMEELELTLTPQTWRGAGVLGCLIVPLDETP